jgi:hypothetical protein
LHTDDLVSFSLNRFKQWDLDLTFLQLIEVINFKEPDCVDLRN